MLFSSALEIIHSTRDNIIYQAAVTILVNFLPLKKTIVHIMDKRKQVYDAFIKVP